MERERKKEKKAILEIFYITCSQAYDIIKTMLTLSVLTPMIVSLKYSTLLRPVLSQFLKFVLKKCFKPTIFWLGNNMIFFHLNKIYFPALPAFA